MGVEETDFFIALKPRGRWTRKIEDRGKAKESWRTVRTQDELRGQIEAELEDFPGQTCRSPSRSSSG